jgi:hypothetical protein
MFNRFQSLLNEENIKYDVGRVDLRTSLNTLS